MSYTINLTNGTKLTDIIDGSIDQSKTDLTLVGRNLTNYGTFYNENLVHLLENFANVTEPNNPIAGQLWYDTSTDILKVYNGIGFAPTGNTIVTGTQPSLNTGGLWINNTTGQMYFNDGTATILAGPIYTKLQGTSGFVTVDVVDTNQINHTVVKLFVANTLIGIYSGESFTPLSPIAGFTGSLTAGFNVGSVSGIASNMPVSTAEFLLENSISYSPSSFMKTNEDNSTSGTLSLLESSFPLIIGSSANIDLTTGGVFQLKSIQQGQDIQITSYNSSSIEAPALYVNANSDSVGIFTNAPTATLDVNGDVLVRGDLTVSGTSTIISSTVLEVSDKLLELGKVSSPSNTTADGGGISLEGGVNGDKTITWTLGTLSWNSSENINLVSGKRYLIDGDAVLTSTALGSGITSAPGLTQVGTLASLQVSVLNFNNNTITNNDLFVISGDINLVPKGSGSVDVNNAKITSVGTPTGAVDAANKSYVDNTVKLASVAISLETTGMSTATIISTYLNKVFPPAEHTTGTKCRAVCTDSGLTSIHLYVLSSGAAWVFDSYL